MDNQIEMFPLDEFEQQTPHNDGDGIDEYAGRVPEPRNIDAISNSSEPQRLDSAELAVPDPQGSTEPDGEATGTSEQVSDRKTSPVFEATGLTGDFELSDHALAFPDTSHEDIVALPWPSLSCFPSGVRVGPRLPRKIVGIPTISPVPPKRREQKLRASVATSSTWPTR